MVRILLLTLLAAACAPANKAGEGSPDPTAGFEPSGERTACVDTFAIAGTKGLGDRAILFRMKNGTLYLNRLEGRCPGLRREEAFTYEVIGRRLCDEDTIDIFERTTGRVLESCALGMFEEVAESNPKAGAPE